FNGAINALAVSADGRWLAAGGWMRVRDATVFRGPGAIVPYTDEMWEDQGVIYVFDLQNQGVQTLRGHRGNVMALAFAPPAGEKRLLVSAAREWDAAAGKGAGAVWAWDLDKGQPLRKWNALAADPKEATPGLGVWRRGDRLEQVQVGLAWRDGQFRVWDVQTDRTWKVPDGQANNTVVPGPGAARGPTARFRAGPPRGRVPEG